MAQPALATADGAFSASRKSAPRSGAAGTRLGAPSLALVASALVAISTLSGCASLQRNAYCALAGAGVMGTAGVIYAVNDDSLDEAEVAAVGVGSAAAGALLGYGICAISDLAD